MKRVSLEQFLNENDIVSIRKVTTEEKWQSVEEAFMDAAWACYRLWCSLGPEKTRLYVLPFITPPPRSGRPQKNPEGDAQLATRYAAQSHGKKQTVVAAEDRRRIQRRVKEAREQEQLFLFMRADRDEPEFREWISERLLQHVKHSKKGIGWQRLHRLDDDGNLIDDNILILIEGDENTP
jgi:hypothetical protein